MQEFKREFISLALQQNALRFGEFTLKSGRRSPYFFNSALFNSGTTLWRLACAYAEAIVANGVSFDMLYGPAYKGIPLATAVAIAFARQHGRDIPCAYNRKEEKDHGEGGIVMGAPLDGRVLIIDDVITAGTSVNESVRIIRAAGATPAGVAIALDRQERGQSGRSAVQEVEQVHGIPVISIINLGEIIGFLEFRGDAQDNLQAIRDYRAEFGTS